jgi:hypothetical protein
VTHELLRSLVPVVCPAQAVPLADAIVTTAELVMTSWSPLMQRAFVAGLVAYDLGALAMPYARGRRARRLTGAAAARYFAWWEHATPMQAQLAGGINKLLSLACYEQPEMMAAVGYQPAPWIAEVRAKRLTVFKAEIAAQDAQLIARDPLRPVPARAKESA